MLWTMLVAVGLAAELWVIIGLGRRVTRRYEADEGAAVAVAVPPAREVPVASPETLLHTVPAPRRAA
jgi:hypothetical protein